MRIPNSMQLDQPWRIHALVVDFTLEDVWELPEISGGLNDFREVVELATRFDPAHADSRPTRFLWGLRDLVGRLFGLGRISVSSTADHQLSIPDTRERSLVDRLPQELRGTVDDVRFEHVPFVPLYRTRDEFAAEMSNRTVHGVMHLTWVSCGVDDYHVRMAVYVKPRGVFGRMYMGLIKPFRYVIVYPALERQLGRAFTEEAQ